VFFDLQASDRLRGRGVRLLDGNADLIGCYRAVRNQPEAVIDALERLAAERTSDPTAHYYDVRDRRFNPQRLALKTGRGGDLRYTAELAAQLIYLNRTDFNGLFRLNARGEFNVPAGRYVRPRICDAENIRCVAAALRQRGLSLTRAHFERMRDEAGTGDFLYIDPPYAPLTRTARFTAYTAGGFGHDEQVHLQQIVIALARRGCHVLLSNSTAREIGDLYARNPAARKAGLRCHPVPARRAINSKAARRGPVQELLITNIERKAPGLGPGA
jgi:DNA adenine methylase